MKKVLIIAIVLLALTACELKGTTIYQESEQYSSGETQEVLITSNVSRIYDKEANVYCWIYDRYTMYGDGAAGMGGISCLPASETTLKVPE